jgi:hypothetical protein
MRPKYGWCPELEGGSRGRRASFSRSVGVVDIDRLERGVDRFDVVDVGDATGEYARGVDGLGVDGRECEGDGGFDADSPSKPKMPGSR